MPWPEQNQHSQNRHLQLGVDLLGLELVWEWASAWEWELE